jgi:hypothetical protein
MIPRILRDERVPRRRRTAMKKRMMGFVLTLGLLIPTAFLGAKPAPPVENRCPRIHEAVRALEVAEAEMRNAKWDYCGEKVEAMKATRHAIEELQQAEKCKDCNGDRDHDRK